MSLPVLNDPNLDLPGRLGALDVGWQWFGGIGAEFHEMTQEGSAATRSLRSRPDAAPVERAWEPRLDRTRDILVGRHGGCAAIEHPRHCAPAA